MSLKDRSLYRQPHFTKALYPFCWARRLRRLSAPLRRRTFSRQTAAGGERPPASGTVAEVIHRPLREWQEFTGRLQAVNTVEFARG